MFFVILSVLIFIYWESSIDDGSMELAAWRENLELKYGIDFKVCAPNKERNNIGPGIHN